MFVLVIPDVHLKPWMFQKADNLLRHGVADRAVCLMDLPDDWDKEYDFVFQISSDPKAGLNVVDNGSFYFFYNKAKDDWILQCDFF